MSSNKHTVPAALTLDWLLRELVSDGLITAAMAQKVVAPAPKKGLAQHPVNIAAAQDWPDRRTASGKLSAEALTQWVAKRADLAYVRIDPLALDMASLTAVVPYAYAVRNGILPLKNTPTQITFAVKIHSPWIGSETWAPF